MTKKSHGKIFSLEKAEVTFLELLSAILSKTKICL